MCCNTIFFVVVTSLVFALVAAQTRASPAASHLPTHLRIVQPTSKEAYEEPMKRVDLTQVEVDMILNVTLPPPQQQVFDVQQPSRTSHLNRVVHDDTDNVNEQQNVNSRKEFNDRNLNNESDNKNSMLLLVREPVIASDITREREKREFDKRNQLREPVRTSEFYQEREYGNANSRNQGFEREPEKNENSFSAGQDQRVNDFVRGREYEATYNYNQGVNHEREGMFHQGNSKNQEHHNEISNQGSHMETRQPPQNGEITYQSNNNRRDVPARENEFNREIKYEEENKLNQNFNRRTELKYNRDTSNNRAPDRSDDRHEILNEELSIKPNRDRTQNSDSNQDKTYERGKPSNHYLPTVESGERPQNRETTHENNNNRRRVVSETVDNKEFNRNAEYEENVIRGTGPKNDHYTSTNRESDSRDDRLEVLNQNFNIMEIQKTTPNWSQNSEILYGGNYKKQNIIREPIRRSESNKDDDYEISENTNQVFSRESEKNLKRKNDRETDDHSNRNEAHERDRLMTENRERPPNTISSNSANNKRQKLIGETISANIFNTEREHEETNKQNKGSNRTPQRKPIPETGFSSTPDHRVDRNDTLKQELKNTDRERSTKVKENTQKAKANPKNTQGKTRRLCERKYSEYIERIFRNDDDTTADANDSEFDGRILASPGEYPHMTALGLKREDKSIDYRCGGSLISENFVITAAHCTNFTGVIPTIARIGDINLMKDEKQLEPQMYSIRKIYVHPEYDGITYYNDIALLQLNASVEFTEFVRPIRLWPRSDLPFSVAFAMGYGATSFARAPTQQLTDFNMTIIANDECNERLPQLDEVPHGIVDSLICAEDLVMHRDTCQGDSGGPLQYNIRGRRRRSRIHYQLIGITSFGLLCRSPNPGVYTRIYSFLDWIESKVWLD